MSISIEELNRMNPDSYQIIDIRDETEIGHGAIPGAVAVAGGCAPKTLRPGSLLDGCLYGCQQLQGE